MKHLRSIATALAFTSLFLALHAPATKIAFTAAEGTSLKKVFTSRLELELDEMRVLRDGQEPDALPDLEMQISSNLEVAVTDEYLALEKGKPTKLRRTFDKIDVGTEMAMEVNLQGQTQTQQTPVRAGSKLEGEAIDFVWNRENSAYDRSFVKEAGDKDLLAGLFEDMDLRAFLPGREVSVGDEWEVKPHDLASVMAPGGDLKLVPEEFAYDMGGMSNQMGELSDWFDENLQGKVNCRFTEIRKQGDSQIAVIAIEMLLKNDVDLTEMAQEELDEVELPTGAGEVEIEHMLINLHIEGEGTLLWNLTTGHFHSLEMQSDIEMKMDIAVSLELTGFGDTLHQQEFDMSGELTFGAKIE